jgi:CBS domain-containing protein
MLIAEVMTSHPVSLKDKDTAQQAAAQMRDKDVGDVLVVDGKGKLRGIVTDRDLAVRLVAEGRSPKSVKLGDLCSDQAIATLTVMDGAEQATAMMRERAIRRIPVVDEDDKPVGIVSIGDLARYDDPKSVLAGISKAEPNH